MTDSPLVRADSVTVSLDGRVVLDDVTLSIGAREYIGLVGPNGGGKTTLVRVLLGLVVPDRGKVVRPGRPSSIGYVPQTLSHDRFFPVSVRDAVLLGSLSRRSLGFSYGAPKRRRANELMKRLALLPLAGRSVGSLSGGERQRVFLARALMADPRLLVLDEPTANIDPEMRGTVYELLAELNGDMAILLVTHDTEGLRGRVDRLLRLDRRIEASIPGGRSVCATTSLRRQEASA